LYHNGRTNPHFSLHKQLSLAVLLNHDERQKSRVYNELPELQERVSTLSESIGTACVGSVARSASAHSPSLTPARWARCISLGKRLCSPFNSCSKETRFAARSRSRAGTGTQ